MMRYCLPILVFWSLGFAQTGLTLPPPQDTPEEVLRTEIILEGRSPLDNQPLTAAQYESLKKKLATSAYPPEIDSEIRQLIFLLQIRNFFKTITPF